MRTRRAAAVTACAVLCAATAAGAGITAGSFSGHVTLTTDYVWRGVSQSRGDPAVQGGFQFEHGSGLFAGLWASSVDFPSNALRDPPRDLEIDYYLGYGRRLGGPWSGSLLVTRYTYPGADPSVDYDYDELGATLQLGAWVAASLRYTDSIFGHDEPALAWELNGRYPLSPRFELAAGVGEFDLDHLLGDSYRYWSLALTATAGRFSFELTAIDTDGSAERLFGEEITGSRLVLSVSATTE